MLKAHVIEEGREPKTPGRGTTQYYYVTDVGRLIAGYFLRNLEVVKEAIVDLSQKQNNPLITFSAQALVKNYANEALWALLDRSFYHLSLAARKRRADTAREVQKLFIEGLFDANLFVGGMEPTDEQI